MLLGRYSSGNWMIILGSASSDYRMIYGLKPFDRRRNR